MNKWVDGWINLHIRYLQIYKFSLRRSGRVCMQQIWSVNVLDGWLADWSCTYMQEGGVFKYLGNSSDQNIRKDVGAFNNLFTKPGDDRDVIFTQPYIGSQGLGTAWWWSIATLSTFYFSSDTVFQRVEPSFRLTVAAVLRPCSIRPWVHGPEVVCSIAVS